MLVAPQPVTAWAGCVGQPVWAWGVGDVLVVVVDAQGAPRVVSRPHRIQRNTLSRTLPEREGGGPLAPEDVDAGPVDLAEPMLIATLEPGEMVILATDGAWEVDPSWRHAGFTESDGAKFLADAARIAFERAKPMPAAEILAASKARWKSQPGGIGARDNAAICVIWSTLESKS